MDFALVYSLGDLVQGSIFDSALPKCVCDFKYILYLTLSARLLSILLINRFNLFRKISSQGIENSKEDYSTKK